MFIKKINVMLLLLTVAILITASCKKNDKAIASDNPVIVSISPEIGEATTLVTILGRNFSPVREDNIVSFNGKNAIVLEASTEELQVVAPEGAESGNITVAVKGLTLEGPLFTYREAALEYLVSTLAGSGTAGYLDGKGLGADFKVPEGITLDQEGNLIITDRTNNRIRKVTLTGVVTTLAGNGEKAAVDGPASTAKFNYPWRSAVDAFGNIYVADRDSHSIRKISTDGMVSTFAGGGEAGFADGQGTTARFNQPLAIAIDATGYIYVADNNNHMIRKITPSGLVTTLAGSTKGYQDGAGDIAQFSNPSGIAVDINGDILVADRNNHRIRRITPDGAVSTIAGTGTAGALDGETSMAKFNQPYGLTVSKTGMIVLADLVNNQIRAIIDGKVSTIAGTVSGFADGPGANARFNGPTDVVVDENGVIYVADATNNRIRKIVASN